MKAGASKASGPPRMRSIGVAVKAARSSRTLRPWFSSARANSVCFSSPRISSTRSMCGGTMRWNGSRWASVHNRSSLRQWSGNERIAST